LSLASAKFSTIAFSLNGQKRLASKDARQTTTQTATMLMIATVLPRGNREDDFGVTLPVILGGPAGRVRVGDDMDLGLQIRSSGWNSAQSLRALLCPPFCGKRSAGKSGDRPPTIPSIVLILM
jgi:hypothetical protein